MKRILSAVLVILTLFSLTACGGNSSNSDLEAMKYQMRLMQQQLDDAKQAGYEPHASADTQTPTPEPVAPLEEESGDLILALHSAIDGETMLIVDGRTELTATATIPEGMAVDYWELNGAPYYEDMEDTFTFTAQGNTVVDARLRMEHKVTTINAEMQFLDSKGKPKGETFTEFVFEEDYENTVTHETLPGGWITVFVEAVIPKGYAVDYWLINDVPYYYNRTVKSFTVHDLNETTVYEVVLKKENAPSSTPKPTNKPTQQPVATPVFTLQPVQTPYLSVPTPEPVQTPYLSVPTPEPVQTPAPTPVTYYNVSCFQCKFSGGGYSGATSGSVPAGTTITVTGNFSSPNWEWYWTGSKPLGSQNSPVTTSSFTYTVNSDCEFQCIGIVN